ncbi:M48 family metalloprotease [Nocardia nova]|uniref:M48 family metalloprotease n=1 Tax=Nocardia nova TaxID=37330 RepID=UPI003711B692
MGACSGVADDAALGRLSPDPFAFPSETVARFGLEVFAVLGTAPILVYILAQKLLPSARAAGSAIGECLGKLPKGLPESVRGEEWTTRLRASIHMESLSLACWPSPSELRAPLIAGVVVAVLIAALALYWVMPWWRIKRRRMAPIPDAVLSTVGPVLAELRSIAGVERVVFLADPYNPHASGLAFGRVGRRYVALGCGLLLPTTDHDTLRAVVLHELAHIRNRDIDPTYLAIAVWRCFAVLVLIPAAVCVLLSGPAEWGVTGGRLAVFAVLILLTRNAVLRSRESYADARAAQWGYTSSLLNILDTARTRPSRIPALVRSHPAPARRKSVLLDVSQLSRPGWWGGFAFGLITTIAIHTVTVFLADLGAPHTAGFVVISAMFLLAAAFGLVLTAFRCQLTELLTGDRVRVDLFAVGLGAGIAASALLAPQSAFAAPDRPTPYFAGIGVVGWLIWAGIVVSTTWLFVRWVTALVRMWLPRIVGYRSPRWPFLAILAVSVAALADWLPYLLELPGYATIAYRDAFPEYPPALVLVGTLALERLVAVPSTKLTVEVLALWILPFAPHLRLRAGRDLAPQSWVSSSDPPHGWRPRGLPIRPGQALNTAANVIWVTIGVVGGIYILAGLVASMTAIPAPVQKALSLLPVAASLLSAPVAAVIATAQARALRPLHGILAACVPAVPIATIGEVNEHIVLCAVGSCTPPKLTAVWSMQWVLLPRVLVLALLLALLVSAITATVRVMRGR